MISIVVPFLPLILAHSVPKWEAPLMSDPGTARRMVNTVPEEAEACEVRRMERYRELLWEQIEGTHERYKAHMETLQPRASLPGELALS
jgi:hypothetical protein